MFMVGSRRPFRLRKSNFRMVFGIIASVNAYLRVIEVKE